MNLCWSSRFSVFLQSKLKLELQHDDSKALKTGRPCSKYPNDHSAIALFRLLSGVG
jgi:hypothetical protein